MKATACFYCGRHVGGGRDHRREGTLRTRDHVIPRVQGGAGMPDNIVTACERCNQAKSNNDAAEFLGFALSFFTSKTRRRMNAGDVAAVFEWWRTL